MKVFVGVEEENWRGGGGGEKLINGGLFSSSCRIEFRFMHLSMNSVV